MSRINFPNISSKENYDREFNLLYLIINPTNTTKSGLGKSKTEKDLSVISNIAIYDIGKDKLIHYFSKEERKNIQHIFYEESYDEKNSKMNFNHENYHIFNNYSIEERPKADKLFLFVFDQVSKQFEFWISARNGENKQMLKTYDEKVIMDWKIDVFNQKVLFINALDEEISIDSFGW